MKIFYNNLFKKSLFLSLHLIIFSSMLAQTPRIVSVEGEKIKIEFNENLHSRVISNLKAGNLILGEFAPSEFIQVQGADITEFQIRDFVTDSYQDKIGKGKKSKLEGVSGDIIKTVTITSYDDFPTMLFFNVSYTNSGKNIMTVDGWTNNHYLFKSIQRDDNKPPFWSYQPGSYGWDNDWLQQINYGFERENYMGMNRVDYGGGTPVVDVWRQDVGLSVGHVELIPRLVSLPVKMSSAKEVNLSLNFKKNMILKPGESLNTYRTFVSVHHGDHFTNLTEYSRFMSAQGIEFKDAPEGAYETHWCGWGYEKDFTLDEFFGTFPMIKKLGYEWVVLDYGWHTEVGDYYLPKDKFPNGDADMRKVVDSIHSIGAKAELWWMPLSAHPCTDMFQKHSENLLLNKDESPVYIEFWKSFFMCPASEEVQKITKDFVIKALRDWGWDGLKIDGNNLNMVPPCYNPEHNHAYPEESVEKLPEFFKMIYETALSIKPDAVIQICPCGTNQSFYILPYMNQSVASDPSNSWQVRQKGKTLKALTRSKVVFFGDHVELSDDKCDFASSVGIGAVIGTKFVWPVGVHMNKESGDVSLTPEKEKEWAKWIKIYKENMLSKGNYRGELYDIGYDRPEAHAIQKGSTMFYAFYAPNFDGEVELRGLENKTYEITDYEQNIYLGEINGPVGVLKTKFNKHLLIKAVSK